MATVAFPIRNQSQQTVIQEIQLLLSSIGSVRILTNSNRLIVSDTGSYLRRVRDLLGGYGLAAVNRHDFINNLRNTQAEIGCELLEPARSRDLDRS